VTIRSNPHRADQRPEPSTSNSEYGNDLGDGASEDPVAPPLRTYRLVFSVEQHDLHDATNGRTSWFRTLPRRNNPTGMFRSPVLDNFLGAPPHIDSDE